MNQTNAHKPKKKKHTYRHMKGFLIFITIFIAVISLAVVLRYIRIKKNIFVYHDHLDDIVLTVEYKKAPADEEEYSVICVSLREYGFFIFDVEGFIQRQALIYNEEDPTQYWKTHYSAGVNSNFMNNYASKIAIGSCLQDIVYYQMARAEGFALSETDMADVEKSAQTMWKGMSAAQRDVLGIDYETVLSLKERRTTAKSYAVVYAQTHNVTGFGGTPEEVLSYDGNFFKQIILPDFKVTYNEDILDKINMGRITVNRE